MILATKEKERLVLDLLGQGKSSREIAKEAKVSFREIGRIKNEEETEYKVKESQALRRVLSSRAYNLFSKGKKAADVAIELNLRASEAITLQREYWDLVRLDSLNEIYRDIKYDIWYFIELYRLAKTAGMNPDHVANLLVIANNNLPTVEYRYINLKAEVTRLEEDKHNLERKSIELDNEITEKSNYLGHYQAACQKEATKLNALRKEWMKLQTVVRDFENNNESYLRVRKIIEEMARSTFSSPKVLLRYAILSLVEAMKIDPKRYDSLIYNGINGIQSTTLSSTVYDDNSATSVYQRERQDSLLAHYSEA